MNHGTVLAALPNHEGEAISMKEIAQAIGLEISTHADWIRAERRLAAAFFAISSSLPGSRALLPGHNHRTQPHSRGTSIPLDMTWPRNRHSHSSGISLQTLTSLYIS